MTGSQKAWVKPELIVLVRSKPEEAVLGSCKGGGFLGFQGNTYNHCWRLQLTVCPQVCFTVATS